MKFCPRPALADLVIGAAVWSLALAAGPARAADAAPKPLEAVPLVYPYDLAMAGTEGRATVQFNIDAGGFAREVTVATASKPAFGLAAKAMVEAERFEPAVEHGKPVARPDVEQEVKFTRDGLDAGARAMIEELKKPQPDFARPRELDQMPPKLMKAVNPVFPQALLASGGKAEAVVQCVIDSQGRVQLPRIVSATTEECGWAAATALLRWRFAPPTKGGQPAAFRINIPLEFVPPKAEAGGN
jgi:TonB family protein